MLIKFYSCCLYIGVLSYFATFDWWYKSGTILICSAGDNILNLLLDEPRQIGKNLFLIVVLSIKLQFSFLQLLLIYFQLKMLSLN